MAFLSTLIQAASVLMLGVATGSSLLLLLRIATRQLPQLVDAVLRGIGSDEFREIYINVVIPYRDWLGLVLMAVVLDLLLLVSPAPGWLLWFETPLGLAIATGTILLGFKIFESFFDGYFLEKVFGEQKKIDSELLALIAALVKFAFLLIVIFTFAQVHRINVIGLVASLGIGGVALAFASQRVLEQVLWSLTLYIDRPFSVDDYIHLPDGTIGRVEATGWRSTKIRLSGKNTLVVAPNSNLAQVNIENLTRARRAISLLDLEFPTAVPDEDKALVHQIVLESTREILGIDRQLTQINFVDGEGESGNPGTRAQAIFFVLGAAETSMELRRSLLEIARDNILERLQRYGIACTARESIVDVAQPMNF